MNKNPAEDPPVPVSVMLIGRNVQEEGHDLIDVHNLDAVFQGVTRLKVLQ